MKSRAYWMASTEYVRFARRIGAHVVRVYKQTFKVTALNPVQAAALDDKRHELATRIGEDF